MNTIPAIPLRDPSFLSPELVPVPALTADQMADVDQIAVKEIHRSLLQMMENAGRSLARTAAGMLPHNESRILVMAGSGGNGGGGLCAARHLLNWGWQADIILSRSKDQFSDAAAHQLRILSRSGYTILEPGEYRTAFETAGLVLDALIGYNLHGAPSGFTAELISIVSSMQKRVLSLDIPSGITATSGTAPGVYIKPECILTLALPKTGLHRTSAPLLLADIGIPPAVYDQIGICMPPLFQHDSVIPLTRV